MNRLFISNIIIGGFDPKDYPNFSDAYIQSAWYYIDPMTDAQLDEINEDSDFIHNYIIDNLF